MLKLISLLFAPRTNAGLRYTPPSINGWRTFAYGAVMVANGFAAVYAVAGLRHNAEAALSQPSVAAALPGVDDLGLEITSEPSAPRNPFQVFVAKKRATRAAPKPLTPPVRPKIPISQKAAVLHLVGILAGDPGQAIIENTRTHQTLTLERGQSVDDLRIEQVLSDRVVLTSDGEQCELVLL